MRCFLLQDQHANAFARNGEHHTFCSLQFFLFWLKKGAKLPPQPVPKSYFFGTVLLTVFISIVLMQCQLAFSTVSKIKFFIPTCILSKWILKHSRSQTVFLTNDVKQMIRIHAILFHWASRLINKLLYRINTFIYCMLLLLSLLLWILDQYTDEERVFTT